MKASILQHTKEESPGKIEEWLIKRNWKIDFVKLYKDKYVLPDYKKYKFIVIMGGPMSVYDENKHPFLINEKKWISEAITKNNISKILGICLGAQLLAYVLGADIKKK